MAWFSTATLQSIVAGASGATKIGLSAITNLPGAANVQQGVQTLADKVSQLNTDLLALSPAKTDGSTPLKYSAFLILANGSQQTALQNAINVLFGSGTYKRYLDLEGATITLNAPITLPATFTNQTRTISRGEIIADAAFAGGTHMFDFTTTQLHQLRLERLNTNGSNVASWFYWTKGDLHFIHCDLKNPKKGAVAGTVGPPGLFTDGSADAGLWTFGGRWSTDEAQVLPTQRRCLAMKVRSGDNKFFNLTASYFKHTLQAESGAYLIDGCHFFQGTTTGDGVEQSQVEHTASIKLTNGYTSTTINNFYHGKSFIELSNETNLTSNRIGGLSIAGMRAYADSGETGFAFIVARDYRSTASPLAIVEDVNITAANFVNRGTVLAMPTKLYNPAAFDRLSFVGVNMDPNTFDGSFMQPQANPCTKQELFATAVTQHPIDFTDLLPFGARPYTVLGLSQEGGSSIAALGVFVNRAGNIARIDTAAAWSGTITATVTANVPGSTGFLDG